MAISEKNGATLINSIIYLSKCKKKIQETKEKPLFGITLYLNVWWFVAQIHFLKFFSKCSILVELEL